MKNYLFSILFTLLNLLSANAQETRTFVSDSIYYSIISEKEVAVAPKGENEYYCGKIRIPSIVKHNNKTYQITQVGDKAFAFCKGLTAITLPTTILSIGERAFINCTNLQSIALPKSLKTIKSRAFTGCTRLASIKIPNSVEKIGEEAFSACYGLQSLTIPASVECIDIKAFAYCRHLDTINIQNTSTQIGNFAFTGTAWYSNQPDGPIYIGDYLYKYKGHITATVKIKEGVKTIGDGAFFKRYDLTAIQIPNSVIRIGNSAFMGCDSIQSISFNQVKEIAAYAFAGCSKLKSINMGEYVTNIGERAFLYCKNIESIEIPSSVKKINSEAFKNCTSLKAIYCQSKTPPLLTSNSVFDEKQNNGCTLYVPQSSAGLYKNPSSKWSKFRRIVEK